jgi:GNAT superfamily N-acetyltransferase
MRRPRLRPAKAAKMVDRIAIIALQFIENVKSSGFRSALRKTVFIDAEMVPVVKDLENSPPPAGPQQGKPFKFVELTKETLPRFNYAYRFKSRFLKVRRNISQGYRAIAVVSGNFVIGDIWYVTWETTKHPRLHEDVDLLFLQPGEKDVYMFDLFVDPCERGKNTGAALMTDALCRLSERGYKKAYGYFDAKNFPALWVHRVLKFNELDRVLFSRYFLKRSSRKKPT